MKISTINPLGSQVYSVVGSDLSPFRHTVDLRASGWNGSCTCDTFKQCCEFLIAQQRGAKRWRCDHINAARQYAMEHEFPRLIEQSEKIIEMPTHYETHNSGDLGL